VAVPYDGTTTVLVGEAPELPPRTVIQLSLLQSESLCQSSTSKQLPPRFQELLTEFDHLFQPPTDLPSQRDCDHSIPLIAGAPPVFIRPYRYAPPLKTEIERQVAEMLDQGIIQKSSSPFSSPVLLVKGPNMARGG
jgi:hypothetical protein